MKQIYVGKSGIDHNGLLAGEPIKAGERIQYVNGKRAHWTTRNAKDSKAIQNWIGVGRNTWINTKGTPFRYINHSCEPSAAIIGTKTVLALRDIRRDEEITIDYSMTDADPFWEMECKCGSKKCRKIIGSIQTVPPDVFRNHMPWIPRFFQRAYIRSYVYKGLGIGTSKPTKKQGKLVGNHLHNT